MVERGYSVREVAGRIGVSVNTLHKWVKSSRPASKEASELEKIRLENQKLRAENRRLQEERDILKRPPRTLQKTPSEVRVYQGPQA